MGKRLLNIFLILVLTITILPIRQVGSMLFNSQWTEELTDHAEQQVDKKESFAKWNLFKGYDFYPCGNGHLPDAEFMFYAFSQRLPFNSSGEIHSPPPNLL